MKVNVETCNNIPTSQKLPFSWENPVKIMPIHKEKKCARRSLNCLNIHGIFKPKLTSPIQWSDAATLAAVLWVHTAQLCHRAFLC